MQPSIQQSQEQLKEHIDMARSEKNLTAVFTDTASAIRAKTGTTETICPLDFADKINAIDTGGGGMKAYLEAGGKCGCSKFKSFDDNINYSDSENIRDMSYMFYKCELLEHAPNMNTSNATTMDDMFYGCSNIKTIPEFNTSNVTRMEDMFNRCYSLTTIPNFDTSKVTTTSYMFNSCEDLIAVPELNTSNVTRMDLMFNNCHNLTALPLLDTSKVNDMSYMLGGCQRPIEVPAFDCSSCTNLRSFMLYAYAVTAIHLKNIKVSLDISDPRNLTREAIVEVLNNLSTVTSTQTLTMGSTNLAKLTDEDKAIATNKGWTLA